VTFVRRQPIYLLPSLYTYLIFFFLELEDRLSAALYYTYLILIYMYLFNLYIYTYFNIYIHI
jgi:hypothetical protein